MNNQFEFLTPYSLIKPYLNGIATAIVGAGPFLLLIYVLYRFSKWLKNNF